ncbi:CBS domain-containing protein [Sulfuriflexus sp.]|uniref:CBS domain-containing protein n=1 Tax=Sulfuriflexus sp. TaxID=2015443 RepID=UPI0028CCF18F|nr:CBS domain-containing protein [Sulfuriflexus sp.]MDT8405552.1 CBS domain-containing protein [Sulfuriflexus sp.]
MTRNILIRVRDVMKTNYDLVDGLVTVSEALEKMQHVDTKSLIVDKRHDDDEYGIVLMSDIAREVIARNRSPERVNIYEIMSKPVVSVDPRMDIRYCARLFDKFGLSRAPVVEDGKIIGVVSYTDMVLKGLATQI